MVGFDGVRLSSLVFAHNFTPPVADLVFLGLAEPGPGFEQYYEGVMQRTLGLPTTLFVLAAEDLAFKEVLLEEQES